MTFARRWDVKRGTVRTDTSPSVSNGSGGVVRFQKIAGAELRAAVVIEAHGEMLVVVPDSEDPAKWAHLGAVLTESEVRKLEASEPMAPEAVRALALVKRQLGGTVEAHRQRVLEALAKFEERQAKRGRLL